MEVSRGRLMKYAFSFEKTGNYLLVKPHGQPADVSDWNRNAEQIFLEADARGVCRVLIDRRNAELDADTMDVIGVSDYLDSQDLQSLGIRLALLADEKDVGIFKMLETALTNRAFNYKLFTDYEAAKAWLSDGC